MESISGTKVEFSFEFSIIVTVMLRTSKTLTSCLVNLDSDVHSEP